MNRPEKLNALSADLINDIVGDMMEPWVLNIQTAVDFSIDPSVKKNLGFLGWVPWGRTVMSFQEPLFSLDIGVVSSPVLTPYGFHLIFLEKRGLSDACE